MKKKFTRKERLTILFDPASDGEIKRRWVEWGKWQQKHEFNSLWDHTKFLFAVRQLFNNSKPGS